MTGLRLMIGLVPALALGGCRRPADPPARPGADASPPDALVVLERGPGGSNAWVENGYAYDKATLDLPPGATLVVPDEARVARGAPAGRVELYMEKWLDYDGEGTRLSIRELRNAMGCATRREGGRLTLATYGEWQTDQGGARLTLLVKVPAGQRVERQSGLSGADSVAQGQREAGDWPTAGRPRAGWSAVPDEPDPDRTTRTHPAE